MTVGSSPLHERAVLAALHRYGRADPERAHDLALRALSLASRSPAALGLLRRLVTPAPDDGHREVFGLRFPAPVGLAGGFDKNGVALPALAAMGFGFVEAGTVTAWAQRGRPRPRVRRIAARQAMVNWMGFPSAGADAVARAQARRRVRPAVPIGWNISRSRATPAGRVVDDHLHCVRALYRHGDYFAINVSSPNTPGLRDVQHSAQLEDLARAVVGEVGTLAAGTAAPAAPVLLKIAPDLDERALDRIVDVCLRTGVAGIIATNTLPTSALPDGARWPAGGLSGSPLASHARRTVAGLAERLTGRLPIVAVGGVTTPGDAAALLEAGATLLQVYTAFVYGGPRLVADINAAVRDDWLRAAPAAPTAAGPMGPTSVAPTGGTSVAPMDPTTPAPPATGPQRVRR
jgi:dihydroorotate dehydrogenase